MINFFLLLTDRMSFPHKKKVRNTHSIIFHNTFLNPLKMVSNLLIFSMNIFILLNEILYHSFVPKRDMTTQGFAGVVLGWACPVSMQLD